MKSIIFATLAFATAAHAQWKVETYDLNGGWNAIYLHGSMAGTPDAIFGSGDGLQVEELWRWNPNPRQVQFTDSPQVSSEGTSEWSVWRRGQP
ncbi:hypothetical protein OAF27_03450, partial [Verrucomicrobiales bacterium]|nr:hypothetical protein [Verrucomicrobiales bacterium]